MKYSTKTNVGLVRKHNEDRYCINKDINLYAVADGMGGHKAGEVASSLAVKVLEDYVVDQKNRFKVDPQTALVQAIQKANWSIYQQSRDNDDLKGMGTTITAAMFEGAYLYLAHVGDSRAYLIHKNKIRQVTQDHSLVNEMVKNGGLTEEEANQHPQKNILTRALGTSPDVEIDVYREKIAKGDILVLCSDGLSNLVYREEIYEMIMASGEVDHIADILVDRAIQRGGYDNVTVVVCQV